MLNENDVVKAVCSHLERGGYVIRQRCTTKQHGIDIIAQKETGKRLLIEAKGATSSRDGSARFGKNFTDNQVWDRVAKGFYTAVCLHSAHSKSGDRVGLALPALQKFKKYLAPLRPILRDIGIEVFLVKPDLSVSRI